MFFPANALRGPDSGSDLCPVDCLRMSVQGERIKKPAPMRGLLGAGLALSKGYEERYSPNARNIRVGSQTKGGEMIPMEPPFDLEEPARPSRNLRRTMIASMAG